MTTPAEQEAERRYPPLWVEPGAHGEEHYAARDKREAFVSGAAFEREQLRELLEAAREYRAVLRLQDQADADLKAHPGNPTRANAVDDAYWKADTAIGRLLAAAAALEEATDE